MYEANKSEREALINTYAWKSDEIDMLETKSDDVRRGVPIPMQTAVVVGEYQSNLQDIRTAQKRWWQFWK